MPSYFDEVVNYKNANVIARYQRDFEKSYIESEAIFQELMKYIWLCVKHNEERIQCPNNPALQFDCAIHEEMLDIDNMWHTFLLFTQDYYAFCNHYLQGKFFHHEPNLQKEIIFPEKYENELNNYLSYICDHLGEKTLLNWFNIKT